jgi:hypothetical protein
VYETKNTQNQVEDIVPFKGIWVGIVNKAFKAVSQPSDLVSFL